MKLFVSALEYSANVHLKYLLRELVRRENIDLFGFFDESVLDSANSQNLGGKSLSLRDSAKQNRGKPPIEKTQKLQGGLPRFAKGKSRNDESKKFCARGTSLCDTNSLAVMGFIDVLKKAKFFLNLRPKCLNLALSADKILLMDSSSFNIPLAKRIKKSDKNRQIIYYILPQVWAWKPWRAKAIEANCDKLAAILPFEVERYKEKAEFVGHPLLDEIKYFRGGNSVANSSCGDFSRSRSPRFLDEPFVLSASLASHERKNSSTILEFASCKNAESTHICHYESFFCHSERSEESKNNPSLRADSQNLRGKPPIEKIQDLQRGLPRSHSLARNDNIFLDSSLATLPQNDKNNVRVAESSADSANSQNLGGKSNKKSLLKFLLLFAFAKSRVPLNPLDSNLPNKVNSQNLQGGWLLRNARKSFGLPRRFCESARNDNLMEIAESSNIFSFMPGSRFGEIKRIFPIFLQVKDALKARDKDAKFHLIVPQKFASQNLAQIYGDVSDFHISFDAHRSLFQSRFAFICSGTATLECALIGTPFVLGYKCRAFEAFIARCFLKIKFIGLANILYEKISPNEMFHTELIQGDLNARNLLNALDSANKSEFLRKSLALRKYLKNGASKAVAKMLYDL